MLGANSTTSFTKTDKQKSIFDVKSVRQCYHIHKSRLCTPNAHSYLLE